MIGLEACWLGLACAAAQVAPSQTPDEPVVSARDAEFFEREVRPLLAERCFKCHGEEQVKSELRVDSRAAILLGGKRGPAAVAGKPDESRLIEAVRRDGKLKMPPTGALTEDEIAALSRWIELGLPWPATPPVANGERAADPAADPSLLVERAFTPEERAFWSFQPLADPVPPAIDAAVASDRVTDLDHFVLAALASHGLEPAPRADRRTLLRRATFDLTGLPPTPEETAAFLADESPDAFARVVDRLLASPGYGERWARHWLDVVRYTDSFDDRSKAGDPTDIGDAWRYRDWVVQAIAADLPFAEFVQDQIAGDLRAEDSGRFDPARVVATGMLAIGEWGGGDSDKEKLLTDIADDQVNVVSRSFLGLTVGCARCHDHKFDPITTADYYGLAGIFFSCHILPEVGAKTSGPPVLRIALASPADLADRARRDARIAELTAQIGARSGGTLLATFAKDIAGIPGVVALRNGGDTPCLTANATSAAASFQTVQLPPRCVSLHPSPNAGVAATWVSPEETTLTISGRVADADAVCGDGIEWTLERRGATGVDVIARGAIDNGGAMELAAAEGGAALGALAVHAGDELRLTILPRAAYECDTTVVEWTLAETAGARAWSLTDDVLAGVARGAIENPLPAAAGASWRFVDRGSAALSPAEVAAAAATDPELAARAAELEQLRASAPPPLEYANGAQEGGVPHTAHEGTHDVAIHVRGRYDRLGAVVPRRFPRILAGDVQPPIPDGSGRRELAAWLASPALALPARVFVNRVWQHHFGAGLVRGGNFGKLGEAPSHPELLDWLACRFLESGGSLAAMHRLILNSATWQQASLAAADAVAADPDDRWLARVKPARLDAEELRDALLAVSGELDATRGGPATRDPQSRRRTLYVATVRSNHSTFRALFDGADPAAVVDQRLETTVAPQALWLLNDDFVLDRAQALAARVEREVAGDADARIARLFELALARLPEAGELAIMRPLVERGSLEEVAHVLLCSNEFQFVD